MANTKFQHKRSSVAGKVPNTSSLSVGEIAINLTDKKMYSSDGSVIFEPAANVTNLNVTANASINAIVANGSYGTAGQILSANSTGGIYWTSPGGASVDVAAQYTWTNTQSFTNTITFNSVINGTANNTQYVGTETSANIVSNTQLQANLANYTNTASFYLDTLVDVNSSGPTSGQVLTWNSSTNLWTPQAVPSVISNTTPGYYGSFYDGNANQTISSISSAYTIRIANTEAQNGVTVVNNTDITIAYSGSYTIAYSVQLVNPANTQEDVDIWLEKNGTNIEESASRFTVNSKSGGGNDGKLVAVTPFLFNCSAGDVFKLKWSASNTQVYIASFGGTTTPFPQPKTPGVIVSVQGVANIISAPPGTNSQIIYNDSGISNASAGFTFNKTTNNVTISNNLFVTSAVNASSLGVDGYFIANSTGVYANNGVYFKPKAGTTSNTSEGSVFYDSLNHALNVYTDGATPHEIGLQNFVRVYNNNGSTLTKGTAVYINGANSDRPTIAKAIANDGITTARSVGIVFENINASSEGFVLTSGLLQDINTSNFTPGQPIYLSAVTAGALSNTEPSYPNYSVILGYALNSTTSGQIVFNNAVERLNLPNTNIFISNGSASVTSNNFTFDYVNNILTVGNSTINAVIGYTNTSGTTTYLQVNGDAPSSVDSVVVNYGTSTNGSADFAAYDSNGPSSYNFVDMGINSNTWNQTFWTINGPSDGYLYTGNTNLSIGTANANYINFFTGGTLTNNERMRITPTGNVGIGNTAPVDKLSVNGTTYLGGAVNTSVGFSVNSTGVYGTLQTTSQPNITANNSNYLGGIAAASYAQLSGATFTGPVGINANVTITGNLVVTGTTMYANVTNLDVRDINITVAKNAATAAGTDGAGLTVDTANIGWYYNYASNTWQSNVGITPSANLSFDLGKSTLQWSNVYANNIVAANLYGTIQTASQPNITANNTSFVGSVSAANVVSNNQLSSNLANYQTTAGLSANVATLTANNTSFVGSVSAANVVSNAQLSSNLSNYQTTAGLSANVATLTANNTSYVGTVTAANVVSNAQLSANLANYTNTAGLSAYQTTAGLSANVATLTANNTSFVGTVSAANVVSNTQLSANLANYTNTAGLSAYQTTAGLSANVATLTSNNANYLGTVAAASYVQNTDSRTLSGNLNFTGANSYFSGNATFTANIVVGSAGDLIINAASGISANGTFGGNGNILTSNGTAVYWSNGLTASSLTANSVAITTGTVTVGNSTVNTDIGNNYISVGNNIGYSNIYSGYIYLGNTVSNATINATIYTGTANNANNLGGVAAAFYVQNTDSRTLSGNLNFTGANSYFSGKVTHNANIVINTGVSIIDSTGAQGTAGQVLTSNGAGNVYWSTVSGGSGGVTAPARQVFTANGTQNTFTVSSGYAANNLDVFLNGVKLQNGVEANVQSGSTFTILTGNPANGSIIEVVGSQTYNAIGTSAIVSQQITANGSANSFAITGGYLANSVLVFLNGVKQIPGTDVFTTSGANVGFAVTPANNYTIDVYGYQQAAISASGLTLSTSQTASGTSVDFTSIPSWVKRITLMFNGISSNGSTSLLAQLGTSSSGIINSGYFSSYQGINAGGTNSSNASTLIGFGLVSVAASDLLYGQVTFISLGNNIWVASSTLARDSSTDAAYFAAGGVTLSGTLDRVRLTWLNGTSAFGGGTVNILYEG